MPLFDTLKTTITRLLGKQKSQLPPFDHARNPYRARHPWPPELLTLTPKQQFRFERKFKRRLTNKSIRPTRNRWIRIITWTIISGTVVHAVWFYDHREDKWNPQPGEQPFEGVRRWTRDYFKDVFPEGWWTYTGSLNDEVDGRGRAIPKAGDREREKGFIERQEEKLGLAKDVDNRAVRRGEGERFANGR